MIITIGLSISSFGAKLQGLVVEIYPYKMGHPFKIAIRHQLVFARAVQHDFMHLQMML